MLYEYLDPYGPIGQEKPNVVPVPVPAPTLREM